MNPSEPIVPAEPSAAPSVRIEAPADYAELQEFRKNFEAQVAPYWDDIRPIIEDENIRTFTRSARETYADRLKAQEPELPPELAMFEKRLEGKFGGVVEYIEGEKSERARVAAEKADAEKAEQARGFAANKAYAERIMAEREDFRTADGNPSPQMEDLIILAAQRKLSIEDAYKEYGPKYFGVKPQVVREPSERKPPSSLRSGDPGVPGESTQPKAQTQKERLARMRANMIAAGGRG